MSKYNKRIINKILVILLMFQFISSTSTTAQELNVLIPELVNQTGTFNGGINNNLYLQTKEVHNLVDSTYITTETDVSATSYNYLSQTNRGNFPAQTPITITQSNEVYRLSNQSNEDLVFEYTYQYYDLLDFRGDKERTGDYRILMEIGRLYGFKINATVNTPMLLELNLDGMSGLSTTIDFHVINVDGSVDSQVDVVINKNTAKFFPLIPEETGEYFIFISPVSENLFVSGLELYDNLTSMDPQEGVFERLTGTEPLVKYYKYNQNSTLPKVIEFGQYIEDNSAIIGSSQYTPIPGLNYLGELEIILFSQVNPDVTKKIYGTDATVNPKETFVLYPNEELYVVIIANPPDDTNPSVRTLKEDLGLNAGYDLNYGFWLNSFDIPQVITNQPITVPDPLYDGIYHYYRLSATSQMTAGLNGTNNALVRFYPYDDHVLGQIDVRENVNDILNFASNALAIIPAGEYVIRMRNGNTIELTLANVQTLSFNQDVTMNALLDVPQYYYLPSANLARENFTFAYLDQLNMTVIFEMDVYNTIGTNIQNQATTSTDFWHVGDITDPEWRFNNETSFTIGATDYNIQGLYLRMELIHNALWNTSVSNPWGGGGSTYPTPNANTIEENNPNTISRLRISRFNYLDNLLSDVNYYYDAPLANGNMWLNESKSLITGYYSFNAVYSAYRIRFESTNISYSINMMSIASADWFSFGINSITATNIDGINHYIFEYEFALTQSDRIGFLINFDMNDPGNGTFSIQIDQIEINQLPNLILPYFQ